MVKKEENETEKLLLDNFIALQEKLVETIKELKEIKKNLSELLAIFRKAEEELKSKGLQKDFSPEIEKKLDKIIEQNKTIAESIITVAETLQEKKLEKEKKKPGLREEKTEEYELEPLPEFNF
ncbi:MAG: hypothetical protein NZ889_00995 [Candidatus Pacearchaeota archaeon]|nr:hypothetical protein [Candidatus Pacearchaeota archaeon]